MTSSTEVQSDIDQKINESMAQLLRVCSMPHQSQVTFIGEIALTALTDKQTLQFLNEGLVKKREEGRQNKTKKHISTARVLTVEDTTSNILNSLTVW
jgi:GMP synthase PP-ATPase subunit